MLAIYKRELKAFFQSVTGWLFVAAMIFLTGIYFMAINLMYGSSSVANTVANSVFIYILIIPILSMRILAEERKQKTDQLTLTAPVS
ncbi:MAG: ABC transporter permease, partial [Lachnospiraceae bacterium]